WAAGRHRFLLLAVTVEVQEVNLVEDAQKRAAHAAEGRVVEVAVVGDEADYAFAVLLDLPLREADELDVVVLQPFRIALAEPLAVDAGIALVLRARRPRRRVAEEKILDEIAAIVGVPAVRRIAEDDRDRLVALDPGRRARLAREGSHAGEAHLAQVAEIEGIGQVELEALVVAGRVAQLREDEAHLQVRDGVRGHHQLETEAVAEQVVAEKRRHTVLAVRLAVSSDGLAEDLHQEGE